MNKLNIIVSTDMEKVQHASGSVVQSCWYMWELYYFHSTTATHLASRPASIGGE